MEYQQQLPPTGFLRVDQIIGNRKSRPQTPALIPVSPATWWAGVKSGRFPAAVKLGPRTTVWRVEDILSFIQSQGMAADAPTPHGASK